MKIFLYNLIIVSLITLSGCGGGGGSEPEPVPDDPIIDPAPDDPDTPIIDPGSSTGQELKWDQGNWDEKSWGY